MALFFATVGRPASVVSSRGVAATASRRRVDIDERRSTPRRPRACSNHWASLSSSCRRRSGAARRRRTRTRSPRSGRRCASAASPTSLRNRDTTRRGASRSWGRGACGSRRKSPCGRSASATRSMRSSRTCRRPAVPPPAPPKRYSTPSTRARLQRRRGSRHGAGAAAARLRRVFREQDGHTVPAGLHAARAVGREGRRARDEPEVGVMSCQSKPRTTHPPPSRENPGPRPASRR